MAREDWPRLPWKYIPSAMGVFNPEHPRAKTGSVIAYDGDHALVSVVREVDEEAGKQISDEHNRLLTQPSD